MLKGKVKKEITREQALQDFLNAKYGNYNPQPTYSFKIGDAVTIGAMDKTHLNKVRKMINEK